MPKHINVFSLSSTPVETRECKFFYQGEEVIYNFFPSSIARLRKADDLTILWWNKYQTDHNGKLTLPQGEYELSYALVADACKLWALWADADEKLGTVEYFLAMACIPAGEPAFCQLLAFVQNLVDEQIEKNALALLTQKPELENISENTGATQS